MAMNRGVQAILSSPWLALVNLALCAAAVAANAHHQVFCRPVAWAAVVLVMVFAPVILLPVLRRRAPRWPRALFFLLGMAACICLYMILFLWEMNLFALIKLLFPLSRPRLAPLAFVPHFLLLQVVLMVFGTEASRAFRRFFAVGVGVCVLYAGAMVVWFNLHYGAIRAAWKREAVAEVPRDYMAERMLGMHFKYHLSFDGFDGWRPPLHDPSVVVAVRLTAPFRSDLDWRGFAPGPYQRNFHLDARIAAYKAVFPGRPIRQACSCARGYRRFYEKDERLR